MAEAQSALESIAQKQQMVIARDGRGRFYINDLLVGETVDAVRRVFSELPPQLLCELKPEYNSAGTITAAHRRVLDAAYQVLLDRRQTAVSAQPVERDSPDPEDHTLYLDP